MSLPEILKERIRNEQASGNFPAHMLHGIVNKILNIVFSRGDLDAGFRYPLRSNAFSNSNPTTDAGLDLNPIPSHPSPDYLVIKYGKTPGLGLGKDLPILVVQVKTARVQLHEAIKQVQDHLDYIKSLNIEVPWPVHGVAIAGGYTTVLIPGEDGGYISNMNVGEDVSIGEDAFVNYLYSRVQTVPPLVAD